MGLVGIDGQRVVRGVEHLGQRDEVEEHAHDGERDGEMPPARTVVERRWQHRERGNAVEEDRDSEPEEGHGRRRRRCGGTFVSISRME